MKRFALCVVVALISCVVPAYADLFVSDSLGNSILRYADPGGTFVDAFVPSGSGGLSSPQGLTFGPDGNLYVTSVSQINRYNGQTGAFIDVFVHAGSGLAFSRDLAFGPDGDLYVINSTPGNSVLRYDGTTGALIDLFVPPGGGGLAETRGLEFGADGKLYVTDHNRGQVKRFDIVTGAFLGDFLSEPVFSPNDAVFGPDGNLYVLAVSSVSSVLRFSGMTGAFLGTFVAPGAGGLVNPQSLLFGPDGNLYIASNCCTLPPVGTPSSVLRYNGATGEFIDVVVPAGLGGLQSPVFLAFAALPQSVPEPSTLILFGLAIFALAAVARPQGTRSRSDDVVFHAASGMNANANATTPGNAFTKRRGKRPGVPTSAFGR